MTKISKGEIPTANEDELTALAFQVENWVNGASLLKSEDDGHLAVTLFSTEEKKALFFALNKETIEEWSAILQENIHIALTEPQLENAAASFHKQKPHPLDTTTWVAKRCPECGRPIQRLQYIDDRRCPEDGHLIETSIYQCPIHGGLDIKAVPEDAMRELREVLKPQGGPT